MHMLHKGFAPVGTHLFSIHQGSSGFDSLDDNPLNSTLAGSILVASLERVNVTKMKWILGIFIFTHFMTRPNYANIKLIELITQLTQKIHFQVDRSEFPSLQYARERKEK